MVEGSVSASAAGTSRAPAAAVSPVQADLLDIPEHLLTLLAHGALVLFDELQQAPGIGGGRSEGIESGIHPQIIHLMPETDCAFSNVENE